MRACWSKTMDEQVTQIGRYAVLSRLGSGGFATVYRVRDTNLDREVALKVMRPLLLSDAHFVERFQQEARVAANLDHPHIVPIYDYGEVEDRLCLVMKLLPGGSLGDRIVAGPLPWDEVVKLTRQVAAALDYAHERGLVHRDIKPENVLLDDEGNAVLGDFGLVRALESGRLTTSLSGGVLGTPAYLAPEVWDGKPGTPPTDIYGLACLVSEMITGAQLFDAPTPPATMTLHFRPPPFPESWPEGTPPGVETLLRRALAHNPEERHPSAGAFAEALGALKEDPLAEPYAALEAAIAAERWQDAMALGETIVDRVPGYREARALLAQATAARVEAEGAAWAAQWQAEAENALEAGDWERALTAAQRWQSFAPEDRAAKAAIERARKGLQPEAASAPEAIEPALVEPKPEIAAEPPDHGQAPEAPAAIEPALAETIVTEPEIRAGEGSESLQARLAEYQAVNLIGRAIGSMSASLRTRIEDYQRRREREDKDAPREAKAAAPQELLEASPTLKQPMSVRRRLARVTAVIALVLVVAGGAAAALLSWSPNDGAHLAVGDSYEGSVGPFNSSDSFVLDDLAGTPVTLEVVPSGGLDPVLEVHGPDGATIGYRDAGGSGGTERITLVPAGGRATITGYEGSWGGYTVRVREAIRAGESLRITRGTLAEGDAHHFAFVAPEGETVTAVVTELAFDMVIELWNEDDGSLLTERTFWRAYDQLTYPVASDGNYTYVVRGQGEEDSGPYSLMLLAPASVIQDVAPGDELFGAFSPDTLFEYWLSVEPGTEVTLSAVPNNDADLVLEVTDDDGNELGFVDDGDDGTSENLTFSAPDDGSGGVTIRLSELNGLGSGYFTLQVAGGGAAAATEGAEAQTVDAVPGEAAPVAEEATGAVEEGAAAQPPFEPVVLLNPDGCGGASRIERIEALERYTVEFALCEPDPAFLVEMALPSFAIAPAAYLEETGGTGDLLAHPVGTGPWRYEDWQMGSEIVFARNDNYWGEPALTERLVFRWSEPAGRLEALQNGEADGIDTPDNTDAVIHDSRLQLVPRTGLNHVLFGINNRFAPFDDVRVRQAVGLAVDRQRLVDHVYGPGTEAASHFSPCGVEYGCAGDGWSGSDQGLARELLAEAGFPDGFETTIYVRDEQNGEVFYRPLVLANELQAQLGEIGIGAEVVALEPADFFGRLDEGGLELYLLGWLSAYPHASSFLSLPADDHLQIFGDPYPEIQAPLAEAASSGDAALYEAANDMIRALVPAVPLVHVGSAPAFRADVEGAHGSAMNVERFARMRPGGRDTLVWMQTHEPASLYCADESEPDTWRACAQVMEGLYGYDESGLAPVPLLAERCEPSEDYAVWVCQLREGVRFHDGSAFDASDVVMTFAVGLDPGHPLHVGNSGRFEHFDFVWGLFDEQ
jgi:peptide/nickel transport system substrate-binding protein